MIVGGTSVDYHRHVLHRQQRDHEFLIAFARVGRKPAQHCRNLSLSSPLWTRKATPSSCYFDRHRGVHARTSANPWSACRWKQAIVNATCRQTRGLMKRVADNGGPAGRIVSCWRLSWVAAGPLWRQSHSANSLMIQKHISNRRPQLQ
jgi:hypothetical protein